MSNDTITPSQKLPPSLGIGVLQLRNLRWRPPSHFVQVVHSDHKVHSPSIGARKNQFKILLCSYNYCKWSLWGFTDLREVHRLQTKFEVDILLYFDISLYRLHSKARIVIIRLSICLKSNRRCYECAINYCSFFYFSKSQRT